MAHTHRMAFNWRMTLEVTRGEENTSWGLRRLDGHENWSFSTWRSSRDPSRIRARDAEAYLQAAGTSSAMTLAITIAEPRNGDTHSQYVLGKPWNGVTPPREVSLEWNGGGTTVFENEVFTADEAAPIFAYYLEHDTVPAEVELRLIDTISY